MVSPVPPGSPPVPPPPGAAPPPAWPVPPPGAPYSPRPPYPPGSPYSPRPPTGGGGGVVIVIAVVGVSLVMVIGILAAIAIPSFIKYKRRAESSEATFSLSRIVHGATAYYETAHTGDSLGGGPRQFPGSTGWTPRTPPCEGGARRYTPEEQDWEQPSWQALSFAMTNPHRYRYRFTSRGQGASATFTVEAEGDLNCNGVRAHYQRVGRVRGDQVVVDPVESENPLD